METDALGQNFGIACDLLALTGNRIAMSGSAEGIWLRDGPSRVLVQGNDFTGRTALGYARQNNRGSIETMLRKAGGQE